MQLHFPAALAAAFIALTAPPTFAQSLSDLPACAVSNPSIPNFESVAYHALTISKKLAYPELRRQAAA